MERSRTGPIGPDRAPQSYHQAFRLWFAQTALSAG